MELLVDTRPPPEADPTGARMTSRSFWRVATAAPGCRAGSVQRYLDALVNGLIMGGIWSVVKIMVPLWFLNIIRHLVFRGRKKRDHGFDNHPYGHTKWTQ